MKKSVIIAIFAIFVASIIAVGFFGMKQVVYNETVYVSSITCINDNATDFGNYKLIQIQFIDGQVNGVQLNYRVEPSNATNNKVRFVYDPNQTVAEVTELGAVIFQRPGVITIDIQSTDGTIASEKVKIVAIR